jgi:hypothetical protein
MKIITIFLLAFCLCACSRGEYFVSPSFRDGHLPGIRSLALDTSFVLYVRQVNRDDEAANGLQEKTGSLGQETVCVKRVEVEYLLLSLKRRMAMYFSTIPDKYQQYYSKYQFADTVINTYDLSTFYFGTVDENGESISFETIDSKKIMTWDLRPFVNSNYPSKIYIREIAVQRNHEMEDIILVAKALGAPVYFERQTGFQFIFYRPGGNQSPDGSQVTLADRNLYYRRHDHGYTIYFRFDKPIGNSKDSTIGFDYKRTRYSRALTGIN